MLTDNLAHATSTLATENDDRTLTPDELFEEMTLPHMDRLVGVARRILGCEHLAWDAVQEGLTALWKEGIEPIDTRGWLVRTVVHRSLHASRTRQRRRRHEETAGERECRRHQGSDHEDPASHLERSEIRDAVTEAVSELSPEFREVFELREFRGMDYDSISKMTGAPVGTVRSRLNRARAALRRILGPKVDEFHTDSEENGR